MRTRGFTLLELIIVLGTIGILVGMLLPAVQACREAARRMSCSNNLAQVVIACREYHATHQMLPPQGTGTFSDRNDPATTNQLRLSFLVAILPQLGQVPAWEMLSQPAPVFKPEDIGMGFSMLPLNGPSQMGPKPKPIAICPAMGPAPDDLSYPLWQFEVATLRCPSDPGTGAPGMGRTNYAACIGDAMVGLGQGYWVYDGTAKQWNDSGKAIVDVTGRGAFVPRSVVTLEQIVDGQSQTILLGEIRTDLGDNNGRTIPVLDCGMTAKRMADIPNESMDLRSDPTMARQFLDPERPLFWDFSSPVQRAAPEEARGFRWADFQPIMTSFNTILPPNQEVALIGNARSAGVLPPSSWHPGGCHIALVDGSVRFMTDSTQCGDSTAAPIHPEQAGASREQESPYGLWGALGTKAGHELVENDW
ncbi:MAG: DUF1559 domain-containing protein [Planctomycetota bacterium]